MTRAWLALAVLAACTGSTPKDSGTDTVDETDLDGDGYTDDDCDDNDADRHPGADELCNDVDDDCDGEVDEDATDATS
jgi:hypothetical protein